MSTCRELYSSLHSDSRVRFIASLYRRVRRTARNRPCPLQHSPAGSHASVLRSGGIHAAVLAGPPRSAGGGPAPFLLAFAPRTSLARRRASVPAVLGRNLRPAAGLAPRCSAARRATLQAPTRPPAHNAPSPAPPQRRSALPNRASMPGPRPPWRKIGHPCPKKTKNESPPRCCRPRLTVGFSAPAGLRAQNPSVGGELRPSQSPYTI